MFSPPVLFYFLQMSDRAVRVAMAPTLLLCAWPLKLLLWWEWLFGRRRGGSSGWSFFLWFCRVRMKGVCGGRLACFLTEGKGATTGLWFWESREREIVEAGVQGRLVCKGFEKGEGRWWNSCWEGRWWNGCWEGNAEGRGQQLSLLREMREETGWLVGETESLCWWPTMGPETGNGRFGFVLGLRGKESFGWREGKMKPKGKAWNRGEGSVGAVVGCLWG